MAYETNRPLQLEQKRKEHYDNIYRRQPQLMKRLNSLLNKSDIIEANTEFLRNPKVNPTSKTFLKKSKDEGSQKIKEQILSQNRFKKRSK